MKTFKQYNENRERQFYYVQKILNTLKYSQNLDSDTISKMSVQEIAKILGTLGMGGFKEALWVKSVVSGGTDLNQDLRSR